MSTQTTTDVPKEIGDDGEFERQESAFRRWVRADGSSEFPAAPDRYHLYVSLACPWASRTVIFRRLKGLENVVGMSVVDPIRDERGWAFTGEAGSDLDPLNGFDFLAEAYRATDPGFDDRVTVPVLWDKETDQIVNNESSEIIRMLNSEFDEWGDDSQDFHPEELRAEIDAVNNVVYDNVNDGVYKAGFATSQAAYERAFERLFSTLDDLEEHLRTRRYLLGDRLTEADWRLFTTLIRFDAVYHGHFKCNLRRLVDYPALWAYTRDLYQHRHPLVAETVDFDHIKRHYYLTHESLNPNRIVPLGPDLDPMEPHARGI
ncbi:MAG: glutathione S-transferase family protein [Acidobacteriota bacterium]